MEKIDTKSLDRFMINLIEFGSYGDVKRYVESLFDAEKRTWRDNLPDIHELKDNKLRMFDMIIQTVYMRFMIMEFGSTCLVNALENSMRGYLTDADLNKRIKDAKKNYEKEKIDLLNELRWKNRGFIPKPIDIVAKTKEYIAERIKEFADNIDSFSITETVVDNAGNKYLITSMTRNSIEVDSGKFRCYWDMKRFNRKFKKIDNPF